MKEEKLFAAMNPEERKAWISEFRTWYSVDFPRVEQGAVGVDEKMVVEKGLHLMNAFTYCRSYVRESLREGNYQRKLGTIRRYANKVVEDVEKQAQTAVNLKDPALLVPHVGRPTKEEAAARALAKAEKVAAEETLFGKETEEVDGDFTPVTAPIVPTGKLPTIAEIRWMLSPGLAVKTEHIRSMRAEAEEASTTAKVLAGKKSPASEIEPYAQKAAEQFEAVEAIYAEVDEEMATAYVRLKEDTAYIAEMAKISKMSNLDLRSWIRPYWDKVEDKEAFKAKVIQYIKANDPAQAAARKEEEEKKAQVDAILKYLQRRDKPNTQKRLVGMRHKLDELRTLIGDKADVYEPLLVAAKEDYETNIHPAEQKKREERMNRKHE